MTALVRMRLAGFTVTGRAIAPLLAALVVLVTIYGGGRQQPGDAYGFSALVLFPVLAWQTKLLLDAEPDTQRRLAVVATGRLGRELSAGLLAAATAALPVVALGLTVPWLVSSMQGPQRPGDLSIRAGIALGVWLHLMVVPPAVALGALASRAVTRQVGRGVAVLAGGAVLAFVLGLRSSPAPWLAPPLMAAARRASEGVSAIDLGLLSGWAVLWTAIAIAGYARLRRAGR